MISRMSALARVVSALCVVAAGVALWNVTFEKKINFDLTSTVHDGGYAYHTVLDTGFWFPIVPKNDSNEFPARSSLVLYEDGKPLGPAHALHRDIREQGNGRFSHWTWGIYFSSSDNTDPRTNGRVYAADVQFVISRTVVVLVAAALALLIAWRELLRLFWAPVLRGRDSGRTLGYLVARRFHQMARWMPSDRTFWVLFALILGSGIVLRLYLLGVIGVPFTVPDSGTYVSPALNTPWFPFSPVRTWGEPQLVAVGLALFGHPIGIILIHSLLWLLSTILFVYAVKKALNARVLALAILFYLCFVQKNLALEFLILAEHAARAMYLITISIMILSFRSTGLRATLFLSAAVVFNILVKPSAVAVLPVALIYYSVTYLFNRQEGRRIVRNAMVFTLIVAGSVTGYMSEFQRRYGSFGFSYFGAMNFYASVGHLTNLESDLHKEIKAELKTFLPLYVEKYAAEGRYAWNWLIYGATNAEMARDFGDKSPARVVRKYSGGGMRETNRIFGELAVEAVMSNKAAYLAYSGEMLWRLWDGGFTMTYGDFFSPRSLDQLHGKDLAAMRGWFGTGSGGPWLARRVHGGLADWQPAPMAAGSASRELLGTVYSGIVWSAVAFRKLVSLIMWPAFAVFGVLAVIITRAGFRRRVSFSASRGLTVNGSFIALTSSEVVVVMLVGCMIMSYSVALSLYLVSDPVRFLAHIQDLIVFSFGFLVIVGVAQVRRVIAALASRVRETRVHASRVMLPAWMERVLHQ